MGAAGGAIHDPSPGDIASVSMVKVWPTIKDPEDRHIPEPGSDKGPNSQAGMTEPFDWGLPTPDIPQEIEDHATRTGATRRGVKHGGGVTGKTRGDVRAEGTESCQPTESPRDTKRLQLVDDRPRFQNVKDRPVFLPTSPEWFHLGS
jgi:hypothetical protein